VPETSHIAANGWVRFRAPFFVEPCISETATGIEPELIGLADLTLNAMTIQTEFVNLGEYDMRTHFSRTLGFAALSVLILLTSEANTATAVEVGALALSLETELETPDFESVAGAPLITANATHSSANGQADATATLNGTTSSLGVAVQASSATAVTQVAVAAFTESFTFTEADNVIFTFDIDGTLTGSTPNAVSLILGASPDIAATDDLSGLLIFADSKPVSSGITTLSVGPIAFEANVARQVSFALVATGLLLSSGDYDADFLSTATLTGVSSPNLGSTGSGNLYNSVISVPEPSAIVLTAFVLLPLGMTRRRRRR
jgi:hypothetical protein